jgi:hypothetical protein
MAFPGLLVHFENQVGSAQGMQQRPVVAVLNGVIRPVVASPALDAQQVAAFVKVLFEELAARRRIRAQQLNFKQGPCRRRKGCLDLHARLGCCGQRDHEQTSATCQPERTQ